MEKYVFYDPKTGRILHTHRAYNFGSEKFQDVPASTLAMMAKRFGGPANAATIVADVPQRFSPGVVVRVDPKKKMLVIERLGRDAWDPKLKGKAPPAEVGAASRKTAGGGKTRTRSRRRATAK